MPSGAIIKTKKLIKAVTATMITIGIMPEKERETWWYHFRHFDLQSFDFEKPGKNSPTKQATIIATNNPWAPKYCVEITLTSSTAKEVGYKIIKAATLVKPTSVASAWKCLAKSWATRKINKLIMLMVPFATEARTCWALSRFGEKSIQLK